MDHCWCTTRSNIYFYKFLGFPITVVLQVNLENVNYKFLIVLQNEWNINLLFCFLMENKLRRNNIYI